MNKLRIFIALALVIVLASPHMTTAEAVQFDSTFKDATPAFVGSPTVYRMENGEVAVIGGVKQNSWAELLKEVYFLNDKYELTRTATLPYVVVHASAFELDHVLYVVGGNAGNLMQADQFENQGVFRYDRQTNTFVIDSTSDEVMLNGELGVRYFMYQGNLLRFVAHVPAGVRYYWAHPDRIEMYRPQVGWIEQKLQVADPIADLYRDVLQREPDEVGLRYWQNRYQEGMSIDNIREQFMKSPEYIKKLATN